MLWMKGIFWFWKMEEGLAMMASREMLTLLLMTIVGTGVAINRSFDRIFLLIFKVFPRKMLFSTLFFTNFVCFWNRVKKVSNYRKTSQITCKTWKTWINLSRQTKNMKRCKDHTSKNFEKDDKLQKGSKSKKNWFINVARYTPDRHGLRLMHLTKRIL